jgi:hypothetical protein
MRPPTTALFVHAEAQWLWPSGRLRTSPHATLSHRPVKREDES